VNFESKDFKPQVFGQQQNQSY